MPTWTQEGGRPIEWGRVSGDYAHHRAGFFTFDDQVPYTRAGWRGRMRACRGVGATLSPDEVAAFDRALEEMLREGPASFGVAHRIDAHVFERAAQEVSR